MSYSQKIIQLLGERIITKSGGWYGMKCPFCGDSPNPKKPHLFIYLDEKNDGMIGMKCFQPKCDVSGVLDDAKAIKMGIYDKEVISFLSDNKGKFNKVIKKIADDVESNIKLKTEEIDLDALEYMKERTEKDFSMPSMVRKYKYITDVKSFLKQNREYITNSDDSKFKLLKDINVVGFLNPTHTMLHCRSILPDTKDGIKHIRIPLVKLPMYIDHAPYTIYQGTKDIDDYEYYHRFYGEGLFDVINTSLHIAFALDKAKYICTSSYSAMRQIIDRETLFKPNKQEVIIKDADINVNMLKSLFTGIEHRIDIKEVMYIYNESGKDFGRVKELLTKPKKLTFTLGP